MPMTLGAALAQGAAGFLANRQARRQYDDETAYAREQDRLQRERLAQRDQLEATRWEQQMAAQQEAARVQREQMAQANARQTMQDQKKAAEEGYGTATEMGAIGALLNQVSTPVGPKRAPAFTVGGEGMYKMRPSLAEAAAQYQASVRASEAKAAAGVRATERAEDRTFQSQRDARNFAQQKQLLNARFDAQQRVPTRAQLPTESERKANALLLVAEQGYKTLESLVTNPDDGKPKAAPGFVDRSLQRIGAGAGNMLTSDELRRASQAGLQLSDMWLRYTSGAAVPEQEVARFAQTFTPLPGDDQTTLGQKTAARAKIIEALRSGAGRALSPDTPGDPAAPNPAARQPGETIQQYNARMRGGR